MADPAFTLLDCWCGCLSPLEYLYRYAKKATMKFNISTIFLLTASLGISLGWYIDHRQRSIPQIIGEWQLTPRQLGYHSLLDIRPDGKFSKVQNYRFGSVTFVGTYRVEENGEIVFEVTSRILSDRLGGEPAKFTMDAEYTCRCGIDSSGCLVVNARGSHVVGSEGKIRIEWKTYGREEWVPNSRR